MIYAQKPLIRALLTSAVGASLLLTAACNDAPETSYGSAAEAVEQGDFQTARIMLQQALKQNPDDAGTIMLYGKTQLALENPEGAAEEFKKLTGHAEFGGEANDLLAKSYAQSGNAKLALETLANSESDSGLSYAVSVVAHLSNGDADEALAALGDGLRKFPDSTDLLVLDAKRAYDIGEFDKARRLLAGLVKERPNMAEARLLAGRMEMYDRNWDGAKEHFSAVIKSSPWNLPAILSMAAIARDEGDTEAAENWLKKTKEVAPGHPVGVYFAAQTAYEAGDVDGAHLLVQSLGTKGAEFPALRLLRGMISAQRGQGFTAIAEIERFFSLGGDNPAARIALAQEYSKADMDQKAWDILQPVLGNANANADTLQLGARIAGALGLPEQVSLVSRAQKAGSADRFAADLVKAGTAIKAGKWKEADKLYAAILNAGGDTNPVILNNAANIRLNVNDKNGAISLARKAFALAPNDPVIMDTLGWSLIQQDQASAEGKDLIRRARVLAPSNREIADHWKVVMEG